MNFQSYYGTPGVRDICHALKQDADISAKRMAIEAVARYMMPFVSHGDILLPAPSHKGRTTYMLEVANLVSKRTGAVVMDILVCEPHEPLYDCKKRGKTVHIKMRAAGHIPAGRKIWFVDSVYATGTTFNAAREALQGHEINPLVFAADEHVRGNKNE